MIGSAGTGSGFGGLQGYLLHGRDGDGEGRVGWVSSRNLAHDDPEYAAVEMRATADQNHRVEKPVYHLSLNAAPGEHLSREQWEQVADRVLKDLGLEDHQALIIAHTDRPHEHVHVMVNRVSPETLKTWSNSHDYARIERSLRHIEREHGLREVPGHHYRLEREQQAPDRSRGLTSGEVHQQQRTGEKPFAEQTRFRLYNDFKEAGSWAELEERLAGHGMRLEKRGRGLVVTDGERQVKASRIHRGRSLGKLEERYGMTFNDWRGRVEELHGAIREYERTERHRNDLAQQRSIARDEFQRAQAPVDSLDRLQEVVTLELRTLHKDLARVYRPKDLDRARAIVENEVHTIGHRKAAERLRRDPRAYGRLRGRPFGRDLDRFEAKEYARGAADTLDRIGEHRRRLIEHLDREVRTLGQFSADSGKVQDPLTQAHWRLETAQQRLDVLLARVYRPEAVARVSRTLEQAPDPQRSAARLASKPERFGKLAGGRRSPERQDALRHAPQLAEAVRELGAARADLHRQVIGIRNANLRKAIDRSTKIGDAWRRLPSQNALLRPIARAAERVGYRALARLVPLPPQLSLVKLAVNTVLRLADRERGGRGR